MSSLTQLMQQLTKSDTSQAQTPLDSLSVALIFQPELMEPSMPSTSSH